MVRLGTAGFLATIFVPVLVWSMDNYHFYRAPFFFGEPRLIEHKLTSLDVAIAAGSSCTSYGCDCCRRLPLLGFCGPYNMHKLGSNVPGKSTREIPDIALIDLDRTVGRDCFGFFEYCGKFTMSEIQFLVRRNLRHGLFTELALPVRTLKLRRVCPVDLSPCDGPCPNITTVQWQNFLQLYDAILSRYGLYAGGFHKTGLGDLSWTVGWGCNYQEAYILDYVDMDFKAGMLFPTGRYKNVDSAFDLPTGYDGHVGFGACVDVAIGAYDWLTFGGHAEAIALLEKTRIVRMKTDIRQNGLIKLAKGCATVEKGTIWSVGTFGKLDHVVNGFSFLVGYSYTAQQRDTLQPECPAIFDPSAANCDCTLAGWDMHTVNIVADYDFGREGNRVSPRIGVFANIVAGGRRILRTHMYGGSCGVDISYTF